MQVAKRYKGVAILWEHRYYGDSLPFPVNVRLFRLVLSDVAHVAQENTTAEQWQFLTTEQALEDVVYFAEHFTLPSSAQAHNPSADLSGADVHPARTPWVWLGGSYPGIRGALPRVRNPGAIFAVWASSAPVHAQVDMAAYYAAAERSLTRNCSADWVAVTRFVDDTLAGGSEEERIVMKQRLLEARARSPQDLTATVSVAVANATSDAGAAGVLMDPLNFYQVRARALSATPHTHDVAVLRLQRICVALLQPPRDAELHGDARREWARGAGGRRVRAGRLPDRACGAQLRRDPAGGGRPCARPVVDVAILLRIR